MKLLLDQQFGPKIAAELRKRGHDAISADEGALRGTADAQLFELATIERRALVTNNVKDYLPLLRFEAEHWGLILTSDAQMPRSRNTVGAYVKSLHTLAQEHPAENALRGRIVWLERHK